MRSFSALLFSLLLVGCATPVPTTVTEVVVGSENHNTLETAVVAANLVETLNGEGPFTVFAPTDAAFAALPAGTLDGLLADPTGDLTKILTFHVVPTKAMAADLKDGQVLTTVSGGELSVSIVDGSVMINGVKVSTADIVAENGVVHVLDGVLLPPAPPAPSNTVVDVIVNSENHATLEAAVIAAGLAETLAGEGPFTVFAPTDAAFAALPEGTVETLLQDPTGDLAKILLYHAVGAKALSTDLTDGQTIATVNGANVTVRINDQGVFINDVKVSVADVEASNGVVHVIDGVLLPKQ
ncbi:fasciclin domain-containing protein [Neolewinella lacunae]|uniref:Fasciclin domain-containing protein n=1 Tax=Neolewinella lacunae TaxID=1517758 RepID=A0A923PIJ5_9BACT|nr:fasciclin domain-containing protein [Neolewinella lacunae]MBC6994727.1 fasciclin domain-containing protein [Neolewinella lacunae]MDN3634599.1 fasciclin domain-containing protein [Neolewinella lacunae]